MSTSKQCRIYFHVYIERLLSWHFGRTQHLTSIRSHNIAGDENSENKDHYSQTIPILRMNKTNIIMSLTRVMVDSFVITLWQTMSL